MMVKNQAAKVIMVTIKLSRIHTLKTKKKIANSTSKIQFQSIAAISLVVASKK